MSCLSFLIHFPAGPNAQNKNLKLSPVCTLLFFVTPHCVFAVNPRCLFAVILQIETVLLLIVVVAVFAVLSLVFFFGLLLCLLGFSWLPLASLCSAFSVLRKSKQREKDNKTVLAIEAAGSWFLAIGQFSNTCC